MKGKVINLNSKSKVLESRSQSKIIAERRKQRKDRLNSLLKKMR